MSPTRNIVLKDLRRLRGAAAVLALSVAVKVACGFVVLFDPQAAERGYLEIISGAANMAIGAEVLVTWFIVALLVHEDNASDPVAFWRSRPIARWRILVAKFAAAAVISVGVPVLVSLPWWVVAGLDPKDTVLAAGETSLWQLLIAGAAFGVAAVTRDMKEFLGATLGFAIVGTLLVAWVTAGVHIGRFARPLFDNLFEHNVPLTEILRGDLGRVFTQLCLLAALAVLGGLAVAACQYLFGIRRNSLRLAFALVAVGGIMASKWRWNALGILAPSETARLGRDVRISSRFAKADSNSADLGEFVLDNRFSVEGIPPGYRTHITTVRQELRWSDGRIRRQLDSTTSGLLGIDTRPLFGIPALTPAERVQEVNRSRVLPKGDTEYAGSERVLGFWDLESFDAGRRKTGFHFSQLEPAEFFAAPPSYLLEAWIDLERPELMGELPLAVGGVLSAGSGKGRITRLTVSERSIDARVVVAEAAPFWRLTMLGFGAEMRGNRSEHDYWLVNRGGVRAMRSFGSPSGNAVRIASVAVFPTGARFLRNQAMSSPTNNNWSDGLTLVGIRYRSVERFARTVAIEKLQVSGIPEKLTPRATAGKLQGQAVVTGAVAKPGTALEIRRPSPTNWPTLLGALRPAGGLLENADVKAIQLIRKNADGTRTVTKHDLTPYFEGRMLEREFPPLEAGDEVHVPTLR